MSDIKVDISKSEAYITKEDIEAIIPEAAAAQRMLHDKTGAGNDFLGWLELPMNIDQMEIDRIKRCAWKIRSDSEILVVVGIGGSYLGAKAATEFFGASSISRMIKQSPGTPHILFAGNSLSASYHAELLDLLQDRDVSINVISKSGTTTEPALAFRLLKDFMEKKYGKKEAASRIYATTDAKKGALCELAKKEGYHTFVIPDDVGGRYSIFTPVGLLPICTAGINIDKMLEGAQRAVSEYSNDDISNNECARYAMARNILYRKGKVIELLVNYEPSLHYFAEWWKQLFGESEGKDKKGIFPAGVDFTTDLHSMGQYIQDGLRNLFETTLIINEPKRNIKIKADDTDSDGLNYLAGMDLDHINKQAFKGTMLAHLDGGVPQITITIPKQDEYTFGRLIYFFEKACGISGYMLGVNPFDQPGVEEYKKNMFALLGKPGYENRM